MGLVAGMPNFESFLPSDEWQVAGVHWHAFAETREHGASPRTGERMARREGKPGAVLRTPLEVASWIDAQTRTHVHNREVWVSSERLWVAIGDEDDLEHLRQENFGIASRGDSIFTDIYSMSEQHDVYVEAVTDEQCIHGCATDKSE